MFKKFSLILLFCLAINMVFMAESHALPPQYTFQVTLVDKILDPAHSPLFGGKDTYQWLYKIEVVTAGDRGHGLSHFTLAFEDCYDLELLEEIASTAGANSGNLAGLTGDQVRSYHIEFGEDGSTGVWGLKWDTISEEQLDEIGEYDYFWFSVPTNDGVPGSGVVKAGRDSIFLAVEVPDCLSCPPQEEPVIPEPTTLMLLGTGLLGLSHRYRRSKEKLSKTY